MTASNRAFRNPNKNFIRTPTFGLPRGTFGRGIYAPQAIVLHSLRCSLDAYDAQVKQGIFIRDAAEPRHPSLHYAIDTEGNLHQYVEDADIAWGMWDYDMTHFPNLFPQGSFGFLTTYPGITPDYYSIHIGAVSGEFGAQQLTPILDTPITVASLITHARLLSWLCHTYEIDCDTNHVTTHDTIDTQFNRVCVDERYPYSQILAAANQIITDGGELLDPIFTHLNIVEEFLGPFTVGVSRVSSAAYISPD